jgi:hypothetical protein
MAPLKTRAKQTPGVIDSGLIAPCGMDCALCSGFLRAKNVCPGCNGDDAGKPGYCVTCRIKTCPELGGSELEGGERSFCFTCAKYPCPRMKQLDKRYRTRYGMSMIENLATIQELGLDEFVARERARWTCPGCGGVICVHRTECVYCGRPRD